MSLKAQKLQSRRERELKEAVSSQRNTGLQAQMCKYRGVESTVGEAQSWKSQASIRKVSGVVAGDRENCMKKFDPERGIY